jgi:hypothetical protein
MTERDEQIIRHIARYRLGLKAVFAKLFFGGNESACANIVQKLLDERRIKSVGGLPGGYHYYLLTEKEANSRGVPENRAERLGEQALRTWFSVLWFCCMGKKRRYLLENSSLEKLIGRSFNAPYCMEEPQGKESARIYRVFTPGAATKPKSIISDIRKHLEEAQNFSSSDPKFPNVAQMMKEHMYAIAVLVDNEARCTQFSELVNDKKTGLKALTKVIVEKVASPLTLQEVIRETRQEPTPDSPTSTKSTKRRPGRRH